MVNFVIACYSLLLLIIFSVSEVNRVINENLYAHICILYMCRNVITLCLGFALNCSVTAPVCVCVCVFLRVCTCVRVHPRLVIYV